MSIPTTGESRNGSPSAPQATSLTLLAKLRENLPDAWSRLDRLYAPLVHSWCARSGVRLSDIPDISQEVFSVVFTRLDSFRRDRPEDTFQGWLRGVTRNIILAHFRRVNHQPRAEGGTDAGRRLAEVPDHLLPEDEEPPAEVAELHHRAMELIHSEFPAHYWQAFFLTAVEGLSAAEAADRLGLSAMTVRQAASRIRKRLKEELCDL